MIRVRYESTVNVLFTPFEVGLRHFKLAFSSGTPDKLTELAKERVIHRSPEGSDFTPLKAGDRVKHIIAGLFETVGYLTLVLPFIAFVVDKILNSSPYKIYMIVGDSPELKTHIEEGGDPAARNKVLPSYRRNPYTDDKIYYDTFYRGAAWDTLPEG